METTIKAHIYDIANAVDLGELEYNLNVDGTYEGDEDFEERLKDDYDRHLKMYLLKKIFEDDDLPDNFLELIETMEIEEISSTEFFKTYNVKIDEPKWDDLDNSRFQKNRKRKLDKIKKSL